LKLQDLVCVPLRLREERRRVEVTFKGNENNNKVYKAIAFSPKFYPEAYAWYLAAGIKKRRVIRHKNLWQKQQHLD
jgi:hypothetical protein